MVTLTERLLELDKAKEVVKTEKTSVVYPVRSGTKNIGIKFNIGGRFAANKKVARNPIPIFNGTEFLKNVNKKVETITSGIVKVQVRPKIKNLDQKDNIELIPSRYIGLESMGGVGSRWANGEIRKLQEMKITALTFLDGE